MYDRAKYCGPLRELVGKCALIMPDETYELPLEQRTLKAQFDGNEDWKLPENLKLAHPETGEFLCYGWHTFPAAHFKILVSV